MANILFREIPSSESGIDYTGTTYGGAWGDVNGDSYPDIWLSNHGTKAILFLNQGNGTFKDVTDQFFLNRPKADFHGTAWADFDNDGDQDLIQLVGADRGVGTGPKQFFVNNEGKLEDQASLLGLDYPLARGRGVLWLDYNKDRLLDVIIGACSRSDELDAPAKIFEQQTDGIFKDVSATVGFGLSNAPYFLLSDLADDRNFELITGTLSSNPPLNVYDISSTPFIDITATTIPPAILAQDVASGDFNADLLPDLYLTRRAFGDNDFYQKDTQSFAAEFHAFRKEVGTKFTTNSEVQFNLSTLDGPFAIPLDQVYIGAKGLHPSNKKFTLSPENKEVQGIYPHTPGVDRGIYIGYDSQSNSWSLLLSSSDKIVLEEKILDSNGLIAFVHGNGPITNLTAIGFDLDAQVASDQLLINTGTGLTDESADAGINSTTIYGKSVVAGDFDNDMDEDIYIVSSRNVVKTANILYENQGDGSFVALPSAGGAIETQLGTGDFVITADYDRDGFLDLLVANGTRNPLRPTKNAPYQLFHNQGNENHWLEIDLEGVLSNRDGIGAQLFLTTNGITQLRQQDGGIHHNVQDHQRVHFGLGDNAQVDSLTIRWPSGIVQRVVKISGDQVIQIKESTVNNFEQKGSSKPDFLLGTAEDDTLKSWGGADTLMGEEGNDRLGGEKGDDSLVGGEGNDFLIGWDGNDTLNGGEGNDWLKGGTDSDRFIFTDYNSLDTIRDFQPGQDTIAISAADFGGNLTVGSNPPLQLGSAADTSDDRFIYNPNTGALFFDLDGDGVGFSQVQIARLSNKPSLSNEDLMII
jgi:Ca2+-binding RTX toxin-like protein